MGFPSDVGKESRVGDSAVAASYAFLNHSPATLPNKLPPSVDDKTLARQKRRRTSPEDQAILEAAYSRDPKPDRSARLELVKQVALGEKEVQIWFQNRRQSTRRKSRPLLPHEIAQYQLGRTNALQLASPGPNDTRDDAIKQQLSYAAQSEAHFAASEARESPHTVFHDSFQDGFTSSNVVQPSQPKPRDSFSLNSDDNTDVQSQPRKYQSVGYLANRRSAHLLPHDDTVHNPQAEHPLAQPRIPGDSLKRSSSVVRISRTSDGNATIVTQDMSSPSPPRPAPVLEQLKPAGNGTSSSSGVRSLDSSVHTTKVTQRSSSGRSRDSRTWEFWCDRDARQDLQHKAEQDASGSAADAIGLLRSASGRTILGSIPMKRNSGVGRQAHVSKRSKLGAPKHSLQRSYTSVDKTHAKQVPKFERAKSAASAINIPGNDSDKENWSPEEDEHSECSSALPASVADWKKTVLCDYEKSSARQTSFASGEGLDAEADPEVASFMRGDRRSSSTQEEDLDCVQGLLSLSQGNWK